MTDRSTDITAADMTGRRLLTRRQIIGATAVAAGYGLVRFGSAAAADPQLNLGAPATALQPAVRVPTTEIVETPATGEILFPIAVGPDDHCYVSDSFGNCRGASCSRSHEGVDIMADEGLVIRATVDGRLTKQYVDSGKSYGAGHGWTLYDESTDTTFKYFHMGSHEEGLQVGDTVTQGQTIGYVGNTGTSGISTDTNHHLHMEYRPDNAPADPFSLLQRDPDVIFES